MHEIQIILSYLYEEALFTGYKHVLLSVSGDWAFKP